MKKKLTIFSLLLVMFLSSCGSYKDLAYFQDVVSNDVNGAIQGANVVKVGDILTISVSSSNPELAIPYNLFAARSQIANSVSQANSSNRIITNVSYEGYTVDSNGDITFPVLGRLRVAGMTRQEIAAMLQQRLADVMPDPVVTVTFINFYITVIGEVNRPGTYNFPGDRATLLEAIGFAGDLTPYGKRSRVQVIREEGGIRHIEVLDLKSSSVFNSPYFYLKQNDVVYIEPISAKAKSVSTFTTYFPIITSLASLGTSIAMMIYYVSYATRINK
ncbi:MAG: polysaccharide biosynthesis/export family protein [Tidjanibacter sp.]|nr:polysaccharide biosynthesis/export family protein [Tidjanibacter sp.]